MNVKLRKLREERHISQGKMADVLNISQSQYFRKESNQAGFTEDEWSKIAEFLGTEIENIKSEDSKILFQYNQGNITNSAYIINISDQLVDELKEHIKTLKEINQDHKAEIQRLKEELNKPS